MRNIIHLEWRQRMKNPFISTGTWRIFIVSKVHAYFFHFFPFPVLFRPNRKSLERSVDLTTHLYFISTFPIAIKIKTLCAKHRVECKQTASHSHQFMRCKQTIRSNNAPAKYTCTDNSTINWKTYLPYDYMQPNSITKTSRKRKTPN